MPMAAVKRWKRNPYRKIKSSSLGRRAGGGWGKQLLALANRMAMIKTHNESLVRFASERRSKITYCDEVIL